nr:uncharacterized protein LOC105319447 [Crassostrea gigas]|eukprot:XP_019919221.1 PREDICTED: uncharacterized protein LOC105319447 [Crassostrea gigas]
MAIVSLYRMCVILIMFHTSAAFNIDRSLCLETIIKFMHGQQKCRFNHTHADGLLRDDNVTCQTKCKVAINDINSYENSLQKVELGFGYEIYEYEPCKWTSYNVQALNMSITCLAWNKGKFIQVNV